MSRHQRRIRERHRRRVDDHQPAAALDEIRRCIFSCSGVAFAAILRVGHDHLGLRRPAPRSASRRAIHLHAALGEQRLPLGEEARMRVDSPARDSFPAANEDSQRLGLAGDGQGRRGEERARRFMGCEAGGRGVGRGAAGETATMPRALAGEHPEKRTTSYRGRTREPLRD